MPRETRLGIEDALAGRPREADISRGVYYDSGYQRGMLMRGVAEFGAIRMTTTHSGSPEAFCFEEGGRRWFEYPFLPRFVSRVSMVSLDCKPVGDHEDIDYWFEGWVEPTAIEAGWQITHYRLFADRTPLDRKRRLKGQRHGVYEAVANRVFANLGGI